jgi:hypothetical protein
MYSRAMGGFMDKLIWKVLTEEQGCKLSGEDCNGKSCLRYYTCKGIASAITKLFIEDVDKAANKATKLREILVAFALDYVENGGQDPREDILDQAHSAILKLFNEEMLRLIGDDEGE